MSNQFEETFVPSIYTPIKIRSIDRVKNVGEVYDLSVKDHGTYCVGDRVIGHNSDMGRYCPLAA